MAVIHYLVNQFLNATVDSSKLMHTFISDHYAKLLNGADVDIVAIRPRALTARTDLRNAISGYISAKAAYRGSTAAFENAVSLLSSTKIKQWDIQIQNVYLEGTTGYIALLPNHRIPFQSGSYEERITHVDALGDRLTDIVALAATKTDVDNFYTSISGLRDTQTQKENLQRASEDAMEVARIAAAWICYQDLGMFMEKFGTSDSALEEVDNYYEFHLIQNVAPPSEPGESFTGTVLNNSTKNITSHDFTAVVSITLKNTGTVKLRFFLSDSASGTAGSVFVDVNGGEEITVDDFSQLGDTAFTFLNVENGDATMDGTYEVIIIEG